VIALLRGRVAALAEESVVLDVGGVGYLVHCAPSTLERLPRAGEAVELLTELQVREDAFLLYGFLDPAERAWFRLLQTVQGVGARVALSILGTLPPARLETALAAGDRAALARSAGVGPRLAARIVAELKDRVGTLETGVASPAAPVAEGGTLGDALSALVNLGYPRSDAYAALGRAQGRLGEQAAVDALIREGLKDLAS
jgi:Holliday junction DNA helicase RuvA